MRYHFLQKDGENHALLFDDQNGEVVRVPIVNRGGTDKTDSLKRDIGVADDEPRPVARVETREEPKAPVELPLKGPKRIVPAIFRGVMQEAGSPGEAVITRKV